MNGRARLLLLLVLVAAAMSDLIRWTAEGVPNPDFDGEKTHISAQLSTPAGCGLKKFPVVKKFLRSDEFFQFDISLNYRSGPPEVIFFDDAIQVTPPLDIGEYAFEELIDLFEQAGTRRA